GAVRAQPGPGCPRTDASCPPPAGAVGTAIKSTPYRRTAMTPSIRMSPRLLAATLLTAGMLAAPALMAQTPAAPLTPEAAAVKKAVEQKLPGTVVRGVVKTPYFGLYEVQLDEQIIYTDTKAKYVLSGSIYDTDARKNLTDARQRELNRIAFDSL